MFVHARRELAPRRVSNALWRAGCRLVCAAVLLATALHAQTNSPAPAAPHSSRYLLIVETSRSMQRRTQGTLDAVRTLLASGMGGQMRRGDTLGVWTFNDQLYAGSFPLQTVSP